MRTFAKNTIAFASAGLLLAGLAACSSADAASSPSTSSSASQSADPAPLASIDSLGGVDTEVTVDQGFVDAITSLGLTPGVLGTATFTDGVFAFPITGGNVDYYDPEESYRPYVQGSVEHEGSGISLTNGTTQVDLTDFRIDPGTSKLFATVSANGALVADDVYLFNLDGSTLKPLSEDADGNAVLEGTTVLVSPDAAKLLNDTYGTDAVTDELVVGIAKITAAPAA
jgi:hypothetical protein